MLRQRLFLTYFVSSLVSNTGTWLQNTVQLLLAYQLSHSPFTVGVVTCAQFSGYLVFGMWAGNVAERLGCRRVLIGAQLVSAAIAGAMAYLQFSGVLSERALIIGALGIGIAYTFALPAQTAMVPRLVPEPDTRAAMAMNSVSYNAGRALAPVTGVVFLASFGAGWAFTLNAFSFVVFAATIIGVLPASAKSPTRLPRDWIGLRIALRRPRILLLLAMVATVTIADDPLLVLGPALSHQVLAVSNVWPGYFLSALGLGAVLGALLPTKPPNSRRAAISLLVLAGSVVVFTAGFAAWLSLSAALVAGIAALLTTASTQTLLLKAAGTGYDTQVMTLWAIAWAGSKPLTSLADGWLASHLGVLDTGLLLAIPAVVMAVLVLWPRTACKVKVKVKVKELLRALAVKRAPSDISHLYPDRRLLVGLTASVPQ